MKKYSGRAANPVDDTVLAPFDGSQHIADGNPTVWALAVRWGSTVHAVTGAVSSDGSRLVPAAKAES